MSWISDTLTDLQSSHCAILTLETADPVRDRDLRGHLANFVSEGGGLYQYHPWTGLETLEVSSGRGRFVRATQATDQATEAYSTGLPTAARTDLKDLSTALEHMDSIMRSRKTAFVLRGMDRAGNNLELNAPLINACRAWVHEQGILAKGSLIVLVTANPSSLLDPATLNLTQHCRPDLGTEDERREVVGQAVAKLNTRVNDQHLHRLAAVTAGLNLHQVNVVISKAYHRTREVSIEAVKHFKSEYIRRSEVLEIEEPSVGFAEVGGYEPVKRMVRESLINVLGDRQRAERLKVPLPRGVLLFGPPGTGKTLFARALAKETNLPFINMKTENLFGPYLGETGQRVRDAIRLVEQAAPCIAFVDEIDRFGRRGAGAGSDGASQETARVFAQMLEWLGSESRRSIIIGTTNTPQNMDPAFLRPGRFSVCVPFLYPDIEAREHILAIHLGLVGGRAKPDMDEPGVRACLPQIAQQTELYSGADIELLISTAKTKAFNSKSERLTAEHLIAAARSYRANVEQNRRFQESYKQLGAEFSTSMEMLEQYQ